MFPYKYLGFRLGLVDEFTKIVTSASGPFIGNHQGLFVCVKSVFFLNSLFFLGGVYNITKLRKRKIG